MQEKPLDVVSSHQDRAHNTSTSVGSLKGQYGSRFSQHTSSVNIGLQTFKSVEVGKIYVPQKSPNMW